MGVLDKTITVSAIRHAPDGKKRNLVITTDGETFGVWPEKIAMFKVGASYDIAVDERVLNGMVLHNITDARTSDTPPATASRQASKQASSSAGKQASRQAGLVQADNSEQIFVCAILKALIQAGEVKNKKEDIWATTQMLKLLWHHTFGETTFRASEAGKIARG